MKLLFLNALKGLKKKKVQMLGIIFMVMLSTAVYTGMNSAIDRLEDKYYTYLDEQNVEDISAGINIDYTKDITSSDLDDMLKTSLKDITEEERKIIEVYRNFLKNPSFDVNIIYSTKAIFDKYDALDIIERKKLDSIKEKYDFYYEKEYSKIVQDKNKLLKVLPYNKDKKINKVYLLEGKLPERANEVTILEGYAKKNNLKIGDKYTIADKQYKIVGFTYAPDYVYPIISMSMPIFDEKNNNIVYMYKEDYDKITGINDNSYAIKYNFKTNRKFEITVSTEEDKKDDKKEITDPILKIFNEKETVMMDMNTVVRIMRIGALQLEFASDRLFAEYFLYLLLAISVVIIIVITKKRIEDERLQIGVLKSLGYNRFSIATSYLVYPILGSLIGGVLGYVIGILVHSPIAGILRSYYSVPLSNYSISFEYLKTSIFVPMIVLSLLSYLIAIIMLRKKPLSLLKEGSNLKVNVFSKLVNKITRLLPFNSRFKYSLAFRSLGKLFIVTITSFCTGLLITLILIGMNLFNNMIDKSFEGMDFKYIAYFNGIYEYEEKDEYSDYILNVIVPIDKIESKDSKTKKVDEDTNLSINGIDLDSKYTKVLNKDKKNIIDKLEDDNKAILSENAKETLNLEVGDKIKLKYQDLEFEYEIVDFNEEYMGITAYVSRSSLAKKINIKENSYSTIYSNNDKYSNMEELDEEEAKAITYLLSVEDLKDNIKTQMDRFNGSVYIVILFASVMALIIIAVIANIVVEENKKTISLMKVLGYDNKRISKIVLNIYTPFIIVAYLLSIPVMIKILKLIVEALVGDIGITIPIEADPLISFIGLLGLLIAYYIAINISKRVLNKIPLAIALKRE
ncbi:MAG: ABC transporter permease [Bacilli bacterium]|nr:ABC transporter permease [Bacilli bacterium]